ncbi:hypothetical protein [Chryseobacterium muglaense]|uniref:Uncharacterized protein n=1 Tax=Chryseobacterium muglaense TaxID=2893752 RepID=A0ABR8M2E2_9FLAO|nr:hypothetical protein [Chryseobacterium muglaense]MBD3904449.1 hypothetical protein [Chryseobacterium muglaense]
MSFHYRGIEYFLGLYSTKYTISIPALKNYFKEIEVKKVDVAHSHAQFLIEEELLNNPKKHR